MMSRNLAKRLERLETRMTPAPAVQCQSAVPLLASRLAAWGIERGANESLAETTARAMGISVRELRAEFWRRAGYTKLPIFADIAPQRVGVTTVWFGSFDGLPTNQPSEHSVGISEAGLYTLSHAGNACSVASCTLRDSGKSADVYLRYPCQHHSYSHSGGRDGKHIPHRLDNLFKLSCDRGRASNPVQRRYLRGSREPQRRPADVSLHGCVRHQAGPGGERP